MQVQGAKLRVHSEQIYEDCKNYRSFKLGEFLTCIHSLIRILPGAG